MNNIDLLLRQQRLLIRSAQLRANLNHSADMIRTPLHVIDRTRTTIEWLYQHPLYPSIALAALVLLKPRRALTWGKHLWGGWLTFQRLRQWLETENLSSPHNDS